MSLVMQSHVGTHDWIEIEPMHTRGITVRLAVCSCYAMRGRVDGYEAEYVLPAPGVAGRRTAEAMAFLIGTWAWALTHPEEAPKTDGSLSNG